MITTILVASSIAAAFQPPRLTEDTAGIQIDGALDEPAWALASTVSELAVVVPDSPAQPLHPTLVRVLYTEDGLYIGVWAEQPRQQQVARLSPHDVWLEGDFIQIGIDPTGTGRYGYIFGIFLGGSAADATLLPERRFNWQWDGPWRRATKSLPDGWSAEAFLPWSMFAMPRSPGKERRIGLYVARWVAALGQRWSWPALPQAHPRFLSAFHPMIVEDIEPRAQITAYPYLAPAYDLVAKEADMRAGLDAFWRPTAQTHVAATILPDFGQVDADELAMNLTAFETFFPEKRSFFLEGQDIFQTGRVNLVHTRRIGAAPVAPTPAAGTRIEGLAKAAEILAAAKLVGQSGSVRYGVMGASEADDEYVLRTGDQVTAAEVAGRDFAAGRILLESKGQGYRAIGVLGTMARTPMATAAVGAVDGRFHTADGRWQLDGQGIFGVRADRSNYGAWLESTMMPTRGDVHSLVIERYGRGLPVNDLGYLQRDDLSWVEYRYARTRAASGMLEEYRTEAQIEHGWNLGGQLVDSSFQLSQWATLRGNATAKAWVGYGLPRWDDRNSRGNGAFRVEDSFVAGVEAWSDKSKRWILGAAVEGHSESLGGFSRALRLVFRMSPSEHFNAEANVKVEQLDGWLVWQAGRTFTTYDGIQITSRINMNALFSPRQQVALSAQWLGLRAAPAAVWEIGEDGHLLASTARHRPMQLARATLVLQLRYRYQLAPLSDIFVVFSRSGDAMGASSYRGLARGSLEHPGASLLMMKIRYRFDM